MITLPLQVMYRCSLISYVVCCVLQTEHVRFPRIRISIMMAVYTMKSTQQSTYGQRNRILCELSFKFVLGNVGLKAEQILRVPKIWQTFAFVLLTGKTKRQP